MNGREELRVEMQNRPLPPNETLGLDCQCLKDIVAGLTTAKQVLLVTVLQKVWGTEKEGAHSLLS